MVSIASLAWTPGSEHQTGGQRLGAALHRQYDNMLRECNGVASLPNLTQIACNRLSLYMFYMCSVCVCVSRYVYAPLCVGECVKFSFLHRFQSSFPTSEQFQTLNRVWAIIIIYSNCAWVICLHTRYPDSVALLRGLQQ